MKRALTSELINKFDERVQEESLNLAKLENLVRCPGCSYAAEIVNEQQKVTPVLDIFLMCITKKQVKCITGL